MTGGRADEPGGEAEPAWVRPVRSRAITHLGYDAKGQALLVRFASGEAYVYGGVPAALVERFLAAPSKGRFFHDQVLDRFSFTHADP